MDKRSELEKLEAEIAADASLPLYGQANLVFGEGNVDCDVLFIGEAPGETEDRLKRPFVGRGGQLLDKEILGIGWKRGDTYITNIVKRRPPQNRDPLPAEIAAYQPYLTRQIEIIHPKVIVTLGRFSMNYFLPNAKITRDRGRLWRAGKWVVYPVLHPAAALRSPDMMKMFQEDFQKLPRAVSGAVAVESAEALAPAMPPARAEKKEPDRPNQAGLF